MERRFCEAPGATRRRNTALRRSATTSCANLRSDVALITRSQTTQLTMHSYETQFSALSPLRNLERSPLRSRGRSSGCFRPRPLQTPSPPTTCSSTSRCSPRMNLKGAHQARKGEELSVKYIAEQFKAFGLKPGNPNGTYTQEVPLAGITSVPGRLVYRRRQNHRR